MVAPGNELVPLVVGPVQITQPDGEVVELTSGNVTRYLMIQQYKNMSRDSDATGREERRSHLGEVAKAVFESFNSSDLGLEELIVRPRRDVAVLRRDDAERDGVRERERVADGDHEVSDAHLRGVAQRD